MITKKFFKGKIGVDVTFEWPKDSVDTKTVSISGDFTEWQLTPMKLNKKNIFSVKIRLPADSNLQFRYLVNESVWVNDPKSDDFILNDLGTENCIISTHNS